MPSISKIVLFLSVSACVNAAVIPREEPTSNVYKIMLADPSFTEIPDLSVQLVKPTSTAVRGNVEFKIDLATDIIPEGEEVFSISMSPADTDRLLFSTTLPNFLSAKSAKNPGSLDWSDNGCSSSPDRPFGYDFLPSCQRHDFGYRNYKSQGRFTENNRGRIDDNFHTDMYNECAKHGGLSGSTCRRTADTYWVAVRTFGGL